jgi:hypothetical protein
LAAWTDVPTTVETSDTAPVSERKIKASGDEMGNDATHNNRRDVDAHSLPGTNQAGKGPALNDREHEDAAVDQTKTPETANDSTTATDSDPGKRRDGSHFSADRWRAGGTGR